MSKFSGGPSGPPPAITKEDERSDIVTGKNVTIQFEETVTDTFLGTPQTPPSKKRKADDAELDAPKLDTINQGSTETLVLFMDIGMGDCTIIVPPKGGKALLIDAGWSHAPEGYQKDGPGYARHLAYLLRHLGVTRLRVILTHGDADHHSLFSHLKNELECVTTITRVYSPAQEKTQKNAKKLREGPADPNVDYITDDSEGESEPKKEPKPQAEDPLHPRKKQKMDEDPESDEKDTPQNALVVPKPVPEKIDKGFEDWKNQKTFFKELGRKAPPPSANGVFKRKIYFETSQVQRPLWGLRAHWLATDVKAVGKSDAEVNNAVSLCMELIFGDASIVLMGDAIGVTQKAALPRLVEGRDKLTTVLKMSHHGSESFDSNEESWIKAVVPSCVIASGAACGHGLPRHGVMHRTDGYVWPMPSHPLTSYTGGGVNYKNFEKIETVSLAQFATLSTGTLVARLSLKGTKTKVEVMWERGDGSGKWHELAPKATTDPMKTD